jgi:hypothetical protein
VLTGERIVRMTMRLKSQGTAADEFFADVAWSPVNPNVQIDVIPERPLAWVDEGEGVEAMSLRELLYYVLLGDGRIADEPT